MTLLKVEHIQAHLDGREILSNISFDCEGGAFIGLLGPNGAGKSTLLKVLAGLLHASQGKVLFEGIPTAEVSPVIRARSIAFLPQDRTIHWPVNVETIVRLGRLPHRTFLNRTAHLDD